MSKLISILFIIACILLISLFVQDIFHIHTYKRSLLYIITVFILKILLSIIGINI